GRIGAERRWQEEGGGQAFVKEPKLVTAVAPAYALVDVYGAAGDLVRRIDVGNLAEPWKQTAQIGAPDRERIAFVRAAPLGLSVAMQAWDGRNVRRGYGSGAGLDGWAEAGADRQSHPEAGAPHCLGS